MVRAGENGEHEEKFLADKRIYATFELKVDFKGYGYEAIYEELVKDRPGDKPKTLENHARSIFAFTGKMEKGDWFVLPSKLAGGLYFGKIVGDYGYDLKATKPYYHSREVEYLREDPIPRSYFRQDLRNSFGAAQTISKPQAIDALKRIQQMADNGWQPEEGSKEDKYVGKDAGKDAVALDVEEEVLDIKELARSSVEDLIEERFKGNKFCDLIESILKAKGYKVFQTPDQGDGGADLLASCDAFGFNDESSICVEVKSGITRMDGPAINKLLGARTNYKAKFALFVSWGGFKERVREKNLDKYLELRLWTKEDVLRELYDCYENLSEEIKAKLPLERIWSVIQEK